MSEVAIKVSVRVSFAKWQGAFPEARKNEHLLGLLGALDGNVWTEEAFMAFVERNLALAALSARDREAMIDPQRKLRAAAERIRTSKGNNRASELAEICLYGVMHEYYGALPAVPKIFYKQNPHDTVKGADSVHVVLEKTGSFSLWYGEAKFYKELTEAKIDVIVKSVEEIFDSQKMQHENSIILGLRDLQLNINDDRIFKCVEKVLSQEGLSDDLIRVLHVPIFLLYEDKQVPVGREIDDSLCDAIVKDQEQKANEYFKRQVEKLAGSIQRYQEISFHLILFPVPDKWMIADAFLNDIESLKGAR